MARECAATALLLELTYAKSYARRNATWVKCDRFFWTRSFGQINKFNGIPDKATIPWAARGRICPDEIGERT